MKTKHISIATIAGLAMTFAAGAEAADVMHIGAANAAIASVVNVPAGYDTIYFSGVLPTLPAAPAAPGDTETQAESVFSKISANLKAQGLTEADVVSMTIYMAAPAGERMDFAGMMKSYSKYYGTPAQPNKPSRSTVQVANLAAVGAMLEVEVTAVRKPK